jgi:hypothetical protein
LTERLPQVTARRLFRSNATLVVVPSDDLVEQWTDKLRTFTPHLPVVRCCGASQHLVFTDLFSPRAELGTDAPLFEARNVVVLTTLPFISGSSAALQVRIYIPMRKKVQFLTIS